MHLFGAYVINLRGATERWESVRTNLDELNIPYVRVEGVAGDLLPDKPKEYNRVLYNISHGKHTNPREVGCYLSHINALKRFLESDDEYGLILEDDATLPKTITELIDTALQHRKHWDVLRLSAHTPGKPLPIAKLTHGYTLAYNIKTLKNTGAYLVNRYAAQCMCEKMLPMSLPYDVALDCEWRYGLKTAYISPLPVLIDYDLPTQIPAAKKIRFFRTTTFKLFHWTRYFQRRKYRMRCFRQATAKNHTS